MPKLSELTDYQPEQVTPSGRLYVSPNMPTSDDSDSYFTKPVAPVPELPADNVVERIIKKLAETEVSGGSKIGNKLFGTGGEERYQLWPEKVIRSALTAIPDAYSGKIPMHDVDPETGELVPSQAMIGRAMDMATFAGAGGVAGTGEGGVALGAGPSLRPALKYKDRLYKGKEGQEHQDVIPPHLYPEFQQMAMNGEDISHYNFGFVNDKGHFLSREDALKYGIDTGLIDPQAGKYGALTSTLMADSSKPGVAIEALAKIKDWKIKGHENEDWFHGTTHDFDKFNLNKGNIENFGGKYPHFTNSPKDASANYAGHGPDLTGRIEKRAEELMNDGPDLKWGSEEYNKNYEKAKAEAAKEIAGPHDGAIIPANIKMENPADITPEGKTWIDFNPKLDKEGEWVKDHPNMGKLLNSLKKQGEKYGFDGQKAFDEVAEKANLYEGDIKASDLHKALKDSEELMYAEHPEGKGMVGSHVASTVFKDLGFDGIVMDAKSAFPNMKNIEEGTKHAIVLKRNTVQSKLTGKTLFADSSKPGTAIEAMKTAQPFYSAVEHTVNSIPQAKMNGEAWLGTLANKPGVKPEELDWTGLKSFLEENKGKPVTKEQVQEHLNNNKVELKEKVSNTPNPRANEIMELDSQARKLEAAGDTEGAATIREQIKAIPKTGDFNPRYKDYQLPGGENYREMLMTLPHKQEAWDQNLIYYMRKYPQVTKEIKTIEDVALAEKHNPAFRETMKGLSPEEVLATARASEQPEITPYKSSHWDEPNILAHVRMNDRTIEGKKSLHLEEIQSDWHQQGRDKGYKGAVPTDQEVKDFFKLKEGANPADYRQEMMEHPAFVQSKVPDAPFKKSWHELALKRMLREAAEKGYDRLSWTPGEAQAARYDLSKSVSEIHYNPNTGYSKILDKRGRDISTGPIPKDKLADTIGKEAAQKLLETKANNLGIHSLTGQDLKIGGEGMKGFYDQIIPKALEKLGKEHGVKVQYNSGKIGRTLAEELKNRGLSEKSFNELSLSQRNKILEKVDAGNPVHYIDLPQSLKDRAMQKGFPLFSSAYPGYIFKPVDGDPFKDKK